MVKQAFQTIQISSRVLAHGELVEFLCTGEALVRDGSKLYRGRPVAVMPGSGVLQLAPVSGPTEFA